MQQTAYAEMAAIDQTHWWYRARRAILSDVIARAVRPPQGARVVEIGCGTGSNLPMLAPFAAADGLIGVEPDAGARAFAAGRAPAELREGRLPDALPVEPGSADLVAMLDVVEHVDDDVAALRAAARLLKPGGALLVTVPAGPGLWSAHDEEHHHKRRYTEAAFMNAVSAAGLKAERISHFNTLLYPLIAAIRWAKTALRRDTPDTGLPPDALNKALEAVFALEKHALFRVPMPFGVSIVAVLRAA